MRLWHRHSWKLIAVHSHETGSTVLWRCGKCERLCKREFPGMSREDLATYVELLP